jgi:K319L-like, PKD domain
VPPADDAGPDNELNAGGSVILDGTNSLVLNETEKIVDNHTEAQDCGPPGDPDSPDCVPPDAYAGPDKEVNVGDSVDLDGSQSKAQNKGGKIVSYKWSLTESDDLCQEGDDLVHADKKKATFTALKGSEGCSYTYELSVTDDKGQTATDSVTVKVNVAVYPPPIADAGPDKEVNVGDSVDLDGSNSHAQTKGGTIVGYQWHWDVNDCPKVTLSGEETNSLKFTVPEGSEGCSYTYELSVTDDKGQTATDSVTVKVNVAVYPPPIADAGPDKEVNVGDSVDLDGSNSHAQTKGGTIVGYQWHWDVNDCPKVTLSGEETNSLKFTVPEGSEGCSYTYELSVTDDKGQTATDSVTVKVNVAVLRIKADDINFQHVANETEPVKEDHRQSGIRLPINVPKIKGCDVGLFTSHNDKLNEISMQGSDALNYKVKTKGIPKTIEYTIRYECKENMATEILKQFELLYKVPLKRPIGEPPIG